MLPEIIVKVKGGIVLDVDWPAELNHKFVVVVQDYDVGNYVEGYNDNIVDKDGRRCIAQRWED